MLLITQTKSLKGRKFLGSLFLGQNQKWPVGSVSEHQGENIFVTIFSQNDSEGQ